MADAEFWHKVADERAAEITRLRAALAASELPCQYCTLSKEDWAKCASGFPGCARADDAMGCPHLGAGLEVSHYRTDNQKLREALEPFSKFAEDEPGRRDDEVWCGRYGRNGRKIVTYGDLRRARAALAEGNSNG